jgi:hypothetical protein
MARSLLDDEQYKLQFAGHETFPLRYGWLNKAYDQVSHVLLKGNGDTNAIFNDESAISIFGVGKNMVVSMRHWALAADVIQIAEPQGGARQGRLEPTPFGKLLLEEGDPYLEHPASLWLIHWHLAARPGRATTWYWAFNELNEPSVDRELLTNRLSRRIAALRESGRMKESRITETTIRRDVECFVRTYLTRPVSGRVVQEDNLESPLSELALLQPVGVGSAFQFRRGPKPTLPDEVFLYGLLAFWRHLYPTRREFSVEAVAHEPGSPGRVFLLDEESVADRLASAADLTRGALRWDESTGMRQVYAHDLGAIDPLDLVRGLYRRTLTARAA